MAYRINNLYIMIHTIQLHNNIIIASRDDDGEWYDYLQRQKCTIERDDVWNEWEYLKCLQKPTNQMEIDGGLFPDIV